VIDHYTLTQPLDAIIFDCDGTLSHIEGIDELARENDVGEQVSELTAAAMGSVGMSPELYQQRLELVRPTQQQVIALAQKYFDHKAPDLLSVIHKLQSLNKNIYIVSAGLLPAVIGFGKLLNIPIENIFAVDIYFDHDGHYVDFDHSSPLVNANGKRVIVQQIKQKYAYLALIGDGLSDYEAHDLVTRFIGYGGAFYRENIKQLCEFYISGASMSLILDFCLTEKEKYQHNLIT
jgi:phosphoserine phosphatase